VEVFAGPAVGYVEIFVHGDSVSFWGRLGKGPGRGSFRIGEHATGTAA
jgi:hypothetical protein